MSRSVRLAIVGCGPRGLQCLETLSRKLTVQQRSRLDVTIFETAEFPGAGCVYDPQQPHVLRMNFAAQHIDFWKVSANQKTCRSGSLIGWLERHYPSWAKSDQYVPRALVGEYLAECFETVLARFHANQIRVVRERVHAIDRRRSLRGRHQANGPRSVRRLKSILCDVQHEDSEWHLTTDSGRSSYFDEVVVTTGHEGLRPSYHLDATSSETEPIFPLPCQSNLSTTAVPPGSRVLIRGFGLTAIDTILALTEGRDDPMSIDIFSRSGRPMLAKPTATVEPISDAFWSPYRQRLRNQKCKHGSLNFERDLWSVVIEAAAELLKRSRESALPVAELVKSFGHRDRATKPLKTSATVDVDDWFHNWSGNSMDSNASLRAMQVSYQVATGRRPKDIPFALGEAWRKLYPELVERISFGGLSESHWPSFKQTACEMERIAFGPPAESIEKLLSLIDSGLVRLHCEQVCDTIDERDFDHVIHAVIAAFNQNVKNGPIGSLLRDGVARIDEPTGGIRIERDGHPEDAPESIAIFGRATEGWVLGNDTLTRTMHTQIEQWAAGLSLRVSKRSSLIAPTISRSPLK